MSSLFTFNVKVINHVDTAEILTKLDTILAAIQTSQAERDAMKKMAADLNQGQADVASAEARNPVPGTGGSAP